MRGQTGAFQPSVPTFLPHSFSMVTNLGDISVAKGKYTVPVGSGQTETGVSSVNGSLETKGQIVLPQ